MSFVLIVYQKIRTLFWVIRQRIKNYHYQPSHEVKNSKYSKEEIEQKIKSVPFWWHHIELGQSVVTPGFQGGPKNHQISKELIKIAHIPEHLSGKRVLDIGCWDGLYSFEAEKRNAKEILAIDSYIRTQNQINKPETGAIGFFVAKDILASKVQHKYLDLYELKKEEIGVFDVVFCLGVLYHLKNPFLALEIISSITKELLIIETQYSERLPTKKAMFFYPNGELLKDPTNWWVPNTNCLKSMLSVAGFKRVELKSKIRSRVVLHAYK